MIIVQDHIKAAKHFNSEFESSTIPSGWIYPNDTDAVFSMRYLDTFTEVSEEYEVR